MDPVKILLLEDDDPLREMLADVLRGRGYHVETAARGEQALTLARDSTFDLVVADVRMEGMDGLEALARLKTVQPDVGSLVVTGYSSEEDSVRAIQIGVEGYLRKPVDLPVFLQSLETIVARRHQKKQLAQKERSAREVAIWGLRLASRRVDPKVEEAAGLSFQLAQAEGESEAAAREAELLALAEGLREEHPLPNELASAVPRLGRFAEAGLALARGQEVEAHFKELLEKDPENLGKRRGLLSLARALEASGDTDGAAQALEVALEEPGSPRETVEALLGLAQTRQAQGRKEEARQLARDAVEAARRLGPEAQTRTGLEAGLMLESPEVLQETRELAGQLDSTAVAALSTLALAYRHGQVEDSEVSPAVEQLDHPQHTEALTQASNWLVPFLLERPGPLLNRLARECPRQFARALFEKEPSNEAKLAAVEALSHGSPEARGILERLQADTESVVREAATAALSQLGRGTLPVLRLHSFGVFEVYQGESRLDDRVWRSQKIRFLLAYLAAEGRPVATDTLTEVFWPNDPAQGRDNLSPAIYHLRRHLRPEGWDQELDYISRAPGWVELNPELPRWHDLQEFQKASAEGEQHREAGNQERAAGCYRRAVRLYQAPYLEGCYLDWALQFRDRLEQKLVEVLTWLAREGLERKHYAETTEFIERLLELDSCSQEGHLISMQCHMAQGMPERAVRQFEQAERTLKQQLDMEPSIAMVEMYQRARLSLT